MKKFILLILIVLLSTSVLAQSSEEAPRLSLKDVRGKALRLSDYKGKVVLINFWATWCPPCRTEIPELIKIQSEYRKQGLRIIGVTYPPEKRSDVRRFMRKAGINYKVAVGTKATKALFSHIDTLPMTVVIDREGNVRDVVEGILYPDEFEQRVKPLLSTKQTVNFAKSNSGL